MKGAPKKAQQHHSLAAQTENRELCQAFIVPPLRCRSTVAGVQVVAAPIRLQSEVGAGGREQDQLIREREGGRDDVSGQVRLHQSVLETLNPAVLCICLMQPSGKHLNKKRFGGKNCGVKHPSHYKCVDIPLESTPPPSYYSKLLIN